MTKVEQIKKWARDNYEVSFGASAIVECMTDEEIDEEFRSLDDAIEFANLKDEQMSNTVDW